MNNDTCNICGEKSESCLTHYGVIPYLWNMTQDYKYRQEFLLNQQRKNAGLGSLNSSLPPKIKTW